MVVVVVVWRVRPTHAHTHTHAHARTRARALTFIACMNVAQRATDGQGLTLTHTYILLNTCRYNGKWVTQPAWGTAAPDCALHPRTRQNHLGNVVSPNIDGMPVTPYYDWTVPNIPADMVNATCVLRIRCACAVVAHRGGGVFGDIFLGLVCMRSV